MNCLRYWARYIRKGKMKGGGMFAPVTKFSQLRA